MPRKRLKFTRLILWSALLIFLLCLYLFGSHGFLALQRMEARVDSLKSANDSLQYQLEQLEAGIRKLKKAEPSIIEEQARNLGLAKEGEKLIIIQVDSSSAKSK